MCILVCVLVMKKRVPTKKVVVSFIFECNGTRNGKGRGGEFGG